MNVLKDVEVALFNTNYDVIFKVNYIKIIALPTFTLVNDLEVVPSIRRSSHPTNRRDKEEGNAVPLCQDKPSRSVINLQESSPPATFLKIPTTKLPSGIDHKPKEYLGLLECMYANLQLQTQLAQPQMAILENLKASMTQLSPGRESKNSSLPALSRNLLLNHLSNSVNELWKN
uniref:TSSK6-activating co-chaperone protein-like n=1 Tax=Tursiops truncatus TaxID=9739 RepID=A0A6J3QBD6_TURTR|nr:TSSK6-activating co-chaperone protein-like [Tursiops truncatus]